MHGPTITYGHETRRRVVVRHARRAGLAVVVLAAAAAAWVVWPRVFAAVERVRAGRILLDPDADPSRRLALAHRHIGTAIPWDDVIYAGPMTVSGVGDATYFVLVHAAWEHVDAGPGGDGVAESSHVLLRVQAETVWVGGLRDNTRGIMRTGPHVFEVPRQTATAGPRTTTAERLGHGVISVTAVPLRRPCGLTEAVHATLLLTLDGDRRVRVELAPDVEAPAR